MLDRASPVAVAWAPEGEYLDLLARPPARSALLLGDLDASRPVAIVLLLDALFDDRVETARRVRDLLRGRRVRPSSLSDYRRRRLKLALRALDGALDGATYREVAEALFSGVPRGEAFKVDSLRAQAIRLVRYGVELMRGGYLGLLRPDPRTRRRPRGR